jgi:phosphatidylinositol alpha-mannosyltransferase
MVRPGELIRIGAPLLVKCNGSTASIPLIRQRKLRVKRTLARERFDILHLHQPLFCRLSLAFLNEIRVMKRRGEKTPAIVGTFHSCGGGGERLLVSCFLGLYLRRFRTAFDCKVAVSVAARDFIRTVLPGDYEIVPNGVDVDRFARQKQGLARFDDGCINVLFVGRLEPRKGIDTLLRAIPLVRRRTSRRFRLIVVGNSTCDRRYRGHMDGMLDTDVVFVGQVSTGDLPRYYRSAHIFCSPAAGGESFGIVLLEAMAAGLAIVGGDNPGYRRVIQPGVNGILIKPNDYHGLAASLAHLMESDEERRRLSEGAARDCARYRWENIFGLVEQLYRRALRGVESGRCAPRSYGYSPLATEPRCGFFRSGNHAGGS